jgi:septal ring factor EnvC (AmiA/AmiB activator)
MKHFLLIAGIIAVFLGPVVAQINQGDFKTKVNTFKASISERKADEQKKMIGDLNGMMNAQINWLKSQIGSLQVEIDTFTAKITRLSKDKYTYRKEIDKLSTEAQGKKKLIEMYNTQMAPEQKLYNELQTLEGDLGGNGIKIFADLDLFTRMLG